MIGDDRFDAIIRSALDGEARSVAARQPTLREQTRRLAERTAPRGATGAPRGVLVPAGLSLTQVILLIVLLLGLLVSAYVGAQLLRTDPRLPPAAFGFAAECDLPARTALAFDEPGTAAILTFGAPDGPDPDHESDHFTLYSDGRFVQDISDPGETIDGTVTGSRIVVRQMTPAGMAAMLDRVTDEGITPGCRMLDTGDAAGDLYAVLPGGTAELVWGPGNSLAFRSTTTEEELALVDLIDDLARPESWLPPGGWLDPSARTLAPDHWLIWRRFEAGDPSASEVRDDFDFEQGLVGDRRLLCRVGDIDDALAVVREQEQEGSVDSVQPVFGAGYECADLATDFDAALAPRPPPTPAPVVGDLADVDPCSLVTPEALAVLETDAVEKRRSRLPLGRPAHSCIVFDSTITFDEPVPEDIVDPLPAGYRATVTLYPTRLAEHEAGQVLDAFFGQRPEPIDGMPASRHVKGCPEDDFVYCTIDVAGWAGGHLLIIEFTNATVPAPTSENVMASEPVIDEELAIAFAEAILGSL